MGFLLFFIIHILIGIAFIYFYGELPKATSTFLMVFFTFTLIYLGIAVFSSL